MTEGENGSRKIGIRYEMKKKHDGSNLHISVWFNCTLLLSFELKERIMTLFKGYLCYTLGPVSLFTSKKKNDNFLCCLSTLESFSCCYHDRFKAIKN